ncbi:MAG: MFS transporter [Methanomassiliicoccales archaeon]|nr:MFS transporter [Methanomassiliicoccales archaeon]
MKASNIQMLSSAGLSASALLIPNIARGQFGSSNWEIGLVVAGYSATAFMSSYVFGRFSDVHGRAFVLKLGIFLTAIATLLQIFASDTYSLMLIRLIVGLCSGIYPAALLAYVYDKDKKVGRFSSYGSLGFGFGVFAAGVIGIYWGIFLFSSIVLFISYALALYLPFEEEEHHKVPFFPIAIIKRNASIYLSIMFRHTGATMIWVIYPIFLADLGADPLFIGAIYAINAFGQFVFMQFCDRYAGFLLIIVGFVMSILTFPSYTLATVYYEIIPAQIMIALAWSTLYVGSIKYVMERNDEKGTAAGLLQSALAISAIIGSVMGGIVAQLYGYHGCMYVATFIAIIGLIIFVGFNWQRIGKRKDLKSAGQ